MVEKCVVFNKEAQLNLSIQFKQTSVEQKSEKSSPPRPDFSTVATFLHNTRQKPIGNEHTQCSPLREKPSVPFPCSPFCECENATQFPVAASIIACLAASGHRYNPRYLFFVALCGFYRAASNL